MMAQQNLSYGRTLATVLLLGLAACGGSSPVGKGAPRDGRAVLVSLDYGRVVDVYSYQRIDTNIGERRNRFNRRLQLIEKDVFISPGIETQPLFDASGEEIVDSNYEFRPFDVQTGHEDLLILWDDRAGPEQARFQSALAGARGGLPQVPASFRGQNTVTRPIPIVPRNAALRLNFDSPLPVDATFFQFNPSALQLLEFRGDPLTTSPVEAFRTLPTRILVKGSSIIVDTTILGLEGGGTTSSTGMPPSVDSVSANIRLAIPSRGSVSEVFFVSEDDVASLNGIDSFGRTSVIRDFRSGNVQDGRFGTLSDVDRPMIVANLDMGIIDMDARGVITVNKRFHQVPIRARFPFVEGALSNSTGLPLGPSAVPGFLPLRSGDFISQIVDVTMPDGTTVERVRVRAEILQNLDIVSTESGTNLGRTSSGSQGETLTTARLRVATLASGTDSLGRPVSFQASTLPNGSDCTMRVHYYEQVPFIDGSGAISDRNWRASFLVMEPRPPRLGAGQQPIPAGSNIDPMSSIAVAFSEPMDLERVDNSNNLVISTATLRDADFAQLIAEPKPAGLSVVPTRFRDQTQDGTLLQLSPQFGHHHMQGTAEEYWFHVLINSAGVTDLAGNQVQLYDDARSPVGNWSVRYTLDSAQDNNVVGWRLYRFESVDEDGTPPGSVDVFGQFRLQNGRLIGAETVRFSRTADVQNLGGISRINRGECWLEVPPPGVSGLVFPLNPPNGGALYWQPRMYDQVFPPNVPAVFLPPNTPQDVGRVIEPHQPRGSRMMMRYLEDDWSLDYRRAAEFALDVEQLFWSPFNDATVLFDIFDRYTMSLSHCDKRPDIKFLLNPGDPAAMPPVPPDCQFVCPSVSSGLSQNFADNVLRGSQQTVVFEDKVYQINPNDAFRAPTGTKYVPYPEFDRTYTWRDSRLINVDATGAVIGLGGARDPGATEPQNDWTSDVDSPWVTSQPPVNFVNAGGTTWVLDPADFRGDRQRDHDPIALPLLVDFKMFPDDARNGIASGANAFQVAMIGPPSNFPLGFPGGYYNQVGVGCALRNPWPWIRIHTTGGLDPNTGQNILVDPANSPLALGGWVKDAGLGDPIQGLFLSPPGDGMLHWSQADFVRRESVVTFGFFDSLQPNRHGLTMANSPTTWTGLGNQSGFPNIETLQTQLGTLRISDMVTQMDPPLSRQPAGTSVVLELRGAEQFENATIYDQVAQDAFDLRGNLLNSNYSCEAYRYSTANSDATGLNPGTVARVEAQGLTRYITEDQVALIRSPATGLLPRYLNMRLTLTNNINVTPAISPSLRSLAVVYRMGVSQ